MNEIEKARVRLVHWIAHNADHVKGYHEVAAALERAGQTEAANLIRGGVESVEAANRQFEQAVTRLSNGELKGLGPHEGQVNKCEGHSDKQEHAHHQSHEHDHPHDEVHGHHHTHEHEHEH